MYDVLSSTYDRSVNAFLEFGYAHAPRLKDVRPYNHEPKTAVLCMFYLVPGYYATLSALVDHINHQVEIHYETILGVKKS